MKQTETEKEVLRVIESRWEKGRDTYGVGIKFDQNANTEEWLTEAIEEAADMLQYLVAARLQLRKRK